MLKREKSEKLQNGFRVFEYSYSLQPFYNLNISHIHVPDKDFNGPALYSIVRTEFFAGPAAFAFKEVYLVCDTVFFRNCPVWAFFPGRTELTVPALFPINVVGNFGYYRTFNVHRYDIDRNPSFNGLGSGIAYKGIGNPLAIFETVFEVAGVMKRALYLSRRKLPILGELKPCSLSLKISSR